MSPFGGYYDQYYAVIYCPAIEDAGLTPRRADDLYRPSAIVQDIWAAVEEARVLIADLTDKNANVFYELGLAHALSKPVVLLTQDMDDVPFDLQAIRVIEYDTAEPEWATTLRGKITSAVQQVLKAPETAVLQPFQRRKRESAAAAESGKDAAVTQLVRDVNVLRAQVNAGLRQSRTIEPAEATRMIRRYVEQGLSDSVIVDTMQPLGPPTGWIQREINRARSIQSRPSGTIDGDSV